MTKDLVPADGHLALREQRQAFGERARALRLRSKKRAKGVRHRTKYLTHLDVWELLRNIYNWEGDVTLIKRIEQGKAQIDPRLAEMLARIFKANDVDSALLSHAAAGPGVAELLFKLLNLHPIFIACMRAADQALSGAITDDEFVEIIRAHVQSIVLEIARSAHLLHTALEQLQFPPRDDDR